MSDEKLDQEKNATPIHGLSETPFGGARQDEAEAAVEAPELEVEVAQEEPAADSQSEVAAEEAQPEEAVEEPVTMEQAMASMGGAGVDYSGTFKSLRVGDVVDGVVVHIDREGVLVDVGTKSEGHIKPHELTRDMSLEPEEVVSVGERIKVYVVESESHEGGPVLSKKRADFENAWDRVDKAFAEGGVLKAMVTDRVKGGLVVDLGIRGFVPASHVGSGKIKNLEKYVGQSMPFKVIEVDRDRRKVVLSNRLAVEDEIKETRKETLASLAEGQIREGIVRRITDYGAFVDLGGVDGLLHISEMSWTRINHPSEAVKVGAKISVMVLRLNLDQGRVSLGLRQILPDPWEDAKRLYSVGDVVKATISRLVPFGAFVQLEGGIEGIIPNSELAHRRINNPEDVVSQGQEVEIKVIDMRPEERRMTLSLRQLQAQQVREREQTEYREYTQSRQEASKTTIGDLIGGQLGEFQFASEEAEKPAKKKTRAKTTKKREVDEAEALAEAEEMMAVEEEIVAEVEAEVAAAAARETEPGVVIESVSETEAEAPEAEAEAPEAAAEAVEAVEAEPEAVEAEAEAVEAVEAEPEAVEAEAEAVEAVEAEPEAVEAEAEAVEAVEAEQDAVEAEAETPEAAEEASKED